MSRVFVRIDERTHARLRQISEREQRPISQIVAELVDWYDRETFWKHMHEGFAELRADPAAWEAYQDEIALWDSTIGDGLQDEESYYSNE